MSEKVFFVLFDAKIKTSAEKKQYCLFVKHLKREGFSLMQKSVYIKYCVDSLSLKVQSGRIKRFTPNNIQVIILSVSKQAFVNGAYYNCRCPQLQANKSVFCI